MRCARASAPGEIAGCFHEIRHQNKAVSIEVLKQELSALDANEQRQLTAFLVSLQGARDEAYRKKLAEKIDRPASEFATLEDLDRRLGLFGN